MSEGERAMMSLNWRRSEELKLCHSRQQFAQQERVRDLIVKPHVWCCCTTKLIGVQDPI
jgi:hypothetical protein